MHDMQMLLVGRSLTLTGWQVALTIDPFCVLRKRTIRRRLAHSSDVQFSAIDSSLPEIFKTALPE